MLYIILKCSQSSPFGAHTATSVVYDKEWENLREMPFEPTVNVNSDCNDAVANSS
jgi:hypothetical protein